MKGQEELLKVQWCFQDWGWAYNCIIFFFNPQLCLCPLRSRGMSAEWEPWIQSCEKGCFLRTLCCSASIEIKRVSSSRVLESNAPDWLIFNKCEHLYKSKKSTLGKIADLEPSSQEWTTQQIDPEVRFVQCSKKLLKAQELHVRLDKPQLFGRTAVESLFSQKKNPSSTD